MIYYLMLILNLTDYGGSLPLLTQLEDPLRIHESPLSTSQKLVPVLPTPPQPPTLSSITSLSPTSLLNPFFGYPASSARGSPFLYHGRRRKRDLLRTLVVLLWARWRRLIIISVLITLGTFSVRQGICKGHPYFPRFSLAWKALSSLRLNSK